MAETKKKWRYSLSCIGFSRCQKKSTFLAEIAETLTVHSTQGLPFFGKKGTKKWQREAVMKVLRRLIFLR